MIKLIWNVTTGIAFLAFASVLLLAGCGTLPEPKTDAFPDEPIAFGTIFGPQPLPGRIVVDGVPVQRDPKTYNPATGRTEYEAAK
jgi:hypothetical protein